MAEWTPDQDPVEKMFEALDEFAELDITKWMNEIGAELKVQPHEGSILGTLIGTLLDRQEKPDPKRIAMYLARLTHGIAELVRRAKGSGETPQ